MARSKFLAYIDDENRQRVARRIYEFIMQQATNKDVVRVSLPGRTLQQNAKLWPMLGDIGRQVQWHGLWLSEEDWKDMFTAVIKQQRAVPGINGGFVVVGGGSSELDVEEFSDLIELMYAFGSERDVVWSEKTNRELAKWQEEQAKRPRREHEV